MKRQIHQSREDYKSKPECDFFHWCAARSHSIQIFFSRPIIYVIKFDAVKGLYATHITAHDFCTTPVHQYSCRAVWSKTRRAPNISLRANMGKSHSTRLPSGSIFVIYIPQFVVKRWAATAPRVFTDLRRVATPVCRWYLGHRGYHWILYLSSRYKVAVSRTVIE